MGSTQSKEKYLKFTIYIVVFVLINIAGITLFARFDMTESKMYSISNISQDVVGTLQDPLTIKVFFTKNLPAPHNNTERYLKDLLEEYAIKANKYFNYSFYDVSAQEDAGSESANSNRELANSYGIRPVQIRVIEEDEIKFKNAFMGLVMIHGDIIEKIPTITSTSGLEYKITMAIRKMNDKISALQNLKDDINISLIMSSSLSEVAEPLMGIKNIHLLPGEIEKTIQEQNDNTYGKLKYSYIDPSKDSAAEEMIKRHSIVTMNWPAVPERNISEGSATIGMVMQYGEKEIFVSLLDIIKIPIIGTQYQLINFEDLTEIINENVETLIDINQRIGYLASGGTLSTIDMSRMNPQAPPNPDTIANFNSLVSANYSVKQVDLKETNIPDNLECLVIARPTEPLSDFELFQIDQALMNGTNLAIFMDQFREVQQQNQAFGFSPGPQLAPFDTGLEKLLNHYGITIKKSIVMDKNSYKQEMPEQYGGGEKQLYFVPTILNRYINKDLAFMKYIKGLITLKASPVTFDQDKLKDKAVTATTLFSSSEQSWEESQNISLNPMFLKEPPSDAEMASQKLAVLLEGEFESYFSGKPVPEKEVPETSEKADENLTAEEGPAPEPEMTKVEGSSRFLSKGKQAKIFVTGTADLLRDNLLDANGASSNSVFVMNVLDALNGNEDIGVMRSKTQVFNPLDEISSISRRVVKIVNIAILPGLVIIFGLIVWAGRKSRQKTLKNTFSKKE